MRLDTPDLAQEVSALMLRMTDVANIEPDEIEVAHRFNALPIGFDFAYCLLRPDGTVISYDPPNEPESAKDPQSLLHTLVYASKRYPSLRQFIPTRPSDASNCSFCSGTGVRGVYIGTSDPARCPACAGLGWDTSSAK